MQRLQTGDTVMVVSGASKGATGKIKKLFLGQGRVVVEGVNIVKRHNKPSPTTAGGIQRKEAPLDMSNVMPVDPGTGKPTRVRIEEKDGKRVRIAKSGAVITAQK